MKHILVLAIILLPFTMTAAFNPPSIPGWEQDGEVEVFTGDNLYNHINGASETYFSYHFQTLWVTRYKKGEAELTLEVYDQGDPINAYGIYSLERPGNASLNPIGAEGYYEESILNFIAGRYYVKLFSFREPDAGSGILLSTAKSLARQLDTNPQLPAIVKAMPAGQMVANSCQFIPDTFMGFEFLGSAFRANYQQDGKTLTLFIIFRESPGEASGVIGKYLEFVKRESTNLKEGPYEISDPFNGKVYLNWKGNFVIGFSGDDLPELRSSLLASLQKNLN